MGLGGVTADVEAPVRQRCPAVAWMGGRGVPTIFSAVCRERLPVSSTCMLPGLGVSSQAEAAALVRLGFEFAVGKTCFTPSILGRPTSSCCWCLSLTGQAPERHFSRHESIPSVWKWMLHTNTRLRGKQVQEKRKGNQVNYEYSSFLCFIISLGKSSEYIKITWTILLRPHLVCLWRLTLI